MADPLTLALIGGGIKAGGALFRYYGRKRPKPFRQTAQGRFLGRMGRTGRFPGSVRSGILGQQSRVLGQQAGLMRARTRGRFAGQGIEGSIATQRDLNLPDIATQRELGITARDLEIQNELSKIRAQEQLAMGEAGREEDIRRFEDERRGALIGGLAGAAQTGVGTFIGQKAYEQESKRFDDFLAKYYGDKTTAITSGVGTRPRIFLGYQRQF